MSDEIETRLESVSREVEQLRVRLGEGVPCTIEELAPRLEALMIALRAAPKSAGLAHVASLNALERALAELASDFRRQQAAAEAALSEINTRLKAATAYARTAASGNPRESE